MARSLRFSCRMGLIGAAAVAAAIGAVVVPGADMTPAVGAPPACAGSAPTEAAALTEAARCGQPVAVTPSQSEYVQVLAQPDGRLRFESAVVPQRARRAGGAWADLDLTLRSGGDGLLRPAVSVADVAFSGGGADAPLVTLRRGGRSLLMWWPGALPAPVVVGETARYGGVLPEVDLVVRATATGFSHALVVKSARAAAHPAVRTVALRLGGDVRVARGPGGVLQAFAGTTLVAQAEPAVMWDSSGLAPDAAGTAVERSTAFTAGDGARTAAVATRVAADRLVLVPDVRLLDDPAVRFPVFVDPAWSVSKSKWAYATSNNCTNTDYSVARVGLSPDGPCDGAVFRSFFEFPTTNGSVSLKGKHIESAYVQMKLYHSWSCSDTWVNMYLTPAINATMKASWSAMGLIRHLDAAAGHANKGTGCSDSPQPDMIMNFTGSVVTSQVLTAATNSWNIIAVGFSARDSDGTDESTQSRWKKFYPANAKLIVDYDAKPSKPTGLQVSGVSCPAGAVGIGTLTPTFSSVYPDADSGQTLTGTYEWIEVPSGGIGTVTDTYPVRKTPPPPAPATANGRGTTAAVAVTNGKMYAYRVRATDPAPYSITGPWSGWCQFWVDTSVPPAPTITSGTIPGPGQPITFTISGTADVAKFQYSWTGPPGVLHTVRAYAGNGTGGIASAFSQPPAVWDTDGTVFSPGDLSGDGQPDVVFRRLGDSSLRVVRGDGAGGFLSGPESLDTGNWSTAQFLFSPGDFTGDGRPDVLYRDQATQNLFMRRGTTAGGLESTSVQIGTGWGSATWIFSPGDFSGDGKPDVLWRKSDGTLYMVRGNGAGGWVTGVSQSIGTGWNGAALFGRGDFSGDGKTDMLYRITSTGDVKLIRGNGAGGWLESTGVLKGNIPVGGAIFVPGDFTGDGKPDVLATMPSPPNFGEVTASGSGTRTATVTLTVHKYGQNVLWARAIDTVGNLGNPSSLELTVARPSPAVARWGLETYPGQTQAQALADGQPALGGDTPLTPTGVTWTPNLRLVGGSTATLGPSGAGLATTTRVVDTTKSFSVALWVRLTDASDNYRAAVSQDGQNSSGFILYNTKDAKSWGFVLYDTDQAGNPAGTFVYAPAILNEWTHLAVVYDAAERQARIYRNGVLTEARTRTAAAWAANGPFRVGTSKTGMVTGLGQVADVQVFNRVLVDHDFTGQLASDPDSGGVDEPGILAPIDVGRWDFELARPCYLQDLADTCDAADGSSFDRWLALTRGASVDAGNRGNGLRLDGYFFPDENPEPWEATHEYGRSAYKAGLTPPDPDGNQFTVWQDTAVLRTDQSFTASVWVRLDRTDKYQMMLSQDSSSNSGFYLYYAPENGGLWKFKMRASPTADDTGASYAVAPAPDVMESWHHVVGVLDVPMRQMRLYIDGDLAAATGVSSAWQPWQAPGPLIIGRSIGSGSVGNYLAGTIDDANVYQGAMTDAAVKIVYESQVVDNPLP